MTGWKTWAAGLGMILGGVGMILSDMSNGGFEHFAEGWGMVTGGLAVIGIGHKLEKAAQ